MGKPSIPDSTEPFQRDNKVSPVWYRFLNELTTQLVASIAGGFAAIANVWAATAGTIFTTDLIELASAPVTLTDAATVALDWDTFINGEVTITANRALGNPTNGQPGTWRTVYVVASSGTRTLTFGANYKGDVPSLTDISSTKAYQLMIYCRSTSHFVVSAKRAL